MAKTLASVEKLDVARVERLDDIKETKEETKKELGSLLNKRIKIDCMDGSIETIFDNHLARFDMWATQLASRGFEHKNPFLDCSMKDAMEFIYWAKSRRVELTDAKFDLFSELNDYLQRDVSALEEFKKHKNEMANEVCKLIIKKYTGSDGKFNPTYIVEIKCTNELSNELKMIENREDSLRDANSIWRAHGNKERNLRQSIEDKIKENTNFEFRITELNHTTYNLTATWW